MWPLKRSDRPLPAPGKVAASCGRPTKSSPGGIGATRRNGCRVRLPDVDRSPGRRQAVAQELLQRGLVARRVGLVACRRVECDEPRDQGDELVPAGLDRIQHPLLRARAHLENPHTQKRQIVPSPPWFRGLTARTDGRAVERDGMDMEFFATADEFEAWLEANGADADEVLVRMAKKHTGVASLDWAAAVDVVLCFGWIDGRSKRIDDDWFVQRFTPRRPRSTWSKVNRQKVEALIAAGRMRAAGLAEIERAKADGRWEAAYDGMATSDVPEDLAAALEAAGLTDAFGELSRQNRYAILHRVQTAKKAETRERRIAKYVGMLAAGETPH